MKFIVVFLVIILITTTWCSTIMAHNHLEVEERENVNANLNQKHEHSHNCVHDDVFIKDRPISSQRYEGHPFDKKNKRTITTASFNPIRIHVDTSELDADLQTQTTLLNTIRDDVTPWVLNKLASVLKVVPVNGNLKVNRYCTSTWHNGNCYAFLEPTTCGFKTVPEEHLAVEKECSSPNTCTDTSGGAGVPNADIILYFGSKNYQACAAEDTTTLAFASSCSRDQYDRPIAGYVNFCSNVINPNNIEVIRYTVLHEIVHALGFSKNEFAFYRDSTGAPRTTRTGPRNDPPHNGYQYVADSTTIITVEERDHTVQKLVLPTVIEKARAHFDCATLNGVELENGGGSGTAGSHWEQRITRGEFMNGQIPSHPVVSVLTLAALADSGWYRVDFTKADPLPWGNNKGCDFVNKNCIKNGNSNFKNHFCTINGQLRCTQNYFAKAQCAVSFYDNALPGYFQYFNQPNRGGVNALEDYCPVYSLYITSSGTSDCRYASNAISSTRNEYWGSSSRCIVNTLSKSGAANTKRGSCYEVDCTNSPTSISIKINGQSVICSATQGEGYEHNVPGMSGKLSCPDIKTICPPPPEDPCENIDCGENGSCSNGVCVCDANWYNSAFDVCDITTCYGHYSNSTSACSGHGSCTAPDSCSCTSGYVGNECETHTCGGIQYTDSTVCSSRGNCTTANTCECDEGYEGAICNSFSCYGFEYGAVDACSGNGQCVSPNNCSCGATYNGLQCQCAGPEGSCVCANNVTNVPTLGANETYCDCTGGYTNAPYCNVPICYGKSGNDSCNGEFHGSCRSPNNCSCTIAYKGDECDIASKCEEFNFCNNKGTCNLGQCQCLNGYTGDSCQHAICYGKSGSDSGLCSGHGTCSAPNSCNCTSGYTGSQCNNPICYGKPSTDSTVCSGRGTCTEPNTCVCTNSSQFGGDECDKPFCFGKSSDDSAVCNGHGECIYVDSCVCNTITETKATGGTENYKGFNKKYQGTACDKYECLNMCAQVCNPNTGECPPGTKSTEDVRDGEETFSAGSISTFSVMSCTIVLLLLFLIFN